MDHSPLNIELGPFKAQKVDHAEKIGTPKKSEISLNEK
jgi:hypothetical protein